MTQSSEQLGVELYQWLIERRPGIARCEAKDIAEMARVLACSAGFMAAVVAVQKGPAHAREVMRRFAFMVEEETTEILLKASGK